MIEQELNGLSEQALLAKLDLVLELFYEQLATVQEVKRYAAVAVQLQGESAAVREKAAQMVATMDALKPAR